MSAGRTKGLLVVAALWNVLGGASALLQPAQHFAQLYTASLVLDQPLQLFFYRCTWINVMAWGLAYLLAAFLPHARTAVVAAGAAGKLVYLLACLSLFTTGVGKAMLLATGLVDGVFAVVFVLMLRAHPTRG